MQKLENNGNEVADDVKTIEVDVNDIVSVNCSYI